MYRGVPPLGYLLAPPWSSINNLWWWLFLMWGFMVGGQPKLRVGGRHHARAADIARSCMCSSQFFSFFENFSKCFWLFKGEKIIFFKKFSNNGLVSKKNGKNFYHFLGGGGRFDTRFPTSDFPYRGNCSNIDQNTQDPVCPLGEGIFTIFQFLKVTYY